MNCCRKVGVVVLVLLAQKLVSAQIHRPKIIDVHMHYNGEPGVLPQMLAVASPSLPLSM